ncbi:MAG: HesA/MoeB/ThiF family protein, partial [Caulobacteraceae bacterium]
MAFTDEEVERYARHLVLREIGGPGQQKLKAAKVLLVGAGGLGAPAALYLAAAGVGTLGLVDDDEVALSNLQRQVLYETRDVGRRKVVVAAERLSRINPHLQVEAHPLRLDETNAAEVLSPYHLVLDGTDSFETRFAVNAACYGLGKPLVSGAIGRWTGQLAVFEAGLTRGRPVG